MALKAVIASLEDVAEGYRGLYTQVGDQYVLDLDDKDYKNRLSEFRDNNIELTKQAQAAKALEEQLEALRTQAAQYEGIDPEAAREAMEKMSAIEEKRLIDAGKLDEVVEQRVGARVERMQADYSGKIKALEEALDKTQTNEGTLRGRLTNVVIDNALQNAVTGVASVRKGAMMDILSRGKQVWSLDDSGNPVPMRDGEVIYGKDGKQPITMEEWGQSLLLEAPYLFEGNAGGGAGGNLNGEAAGVVKFNDTDGLSANLEDIASGKVRVVE